MAPYFDVPIQKFFFFWGHTVVPGRVTKTCLSQWYPCRFMVDDTTYYNAEQYMMAEKARLMGDYSTRRLILKETDPKSVKKYGRMVHNFDEALWDSKKFEVVVQGNLHKFSQNSSLRMFLLNTMDYILVEASPYDKIWGIGLAEREAARMSPKLWPGQNLLGLALMQVRNSLR